MKKYEKLKFHHSNGVGNFDWGKSRNNLFTRFYDTNDIVDDIEEEAELEAILEEDPEFIDAYNSLGWLEIEACNYGNALYYFEQGFKIGNLVIPKSFNGEIIWAIMDNRPFLRSLHGLGLSLLCMQEFEEAIQYFNKNLKYNSNDNQGIRALLIHCYMALGDFNSILKICRIFSNDTMPDTMYGKVFALYHLGKVSEAQKALHDALQFLPLVADELISDKHKPAYSKIPGTLTVGGKDEAYDYWKRVGQYWTNLGLKLFLKTNRT